MFEFFDQMQTSFGRIFELGANLLLHSDINQRNLYLAAKNKREGKREREVRQVAINSEFFDRNSTNSF